MTYRIEAVPMTLSHLSHLQGYFYCKPFSVIFSTAVQLRTKFQRT